MPSLAEVPDLPWDRLAAEMKANINLGLAAGECVRAEAPLREKPFFARGRMAVAFASILALVVTGMFLQHYPRPAGQSGFEGVELQSTENGIQVRERGGALRLLHDGAKNVTYTHGAQGSIRRQLRGSGYRLRNGDEGVCELARRPCLRRWGC